MGISRIYYVISGLVVFSDVGSSDGERRWTVCGRCLLMWPTWVWVLLRWILFMVLQKIDKNLEKSWKNWDNACWAEILVWEWRNCRLWLIYEGFKPSQDTKLPIFIFWDFILMNFTTRITKKIRIKNKMRFLDLTNL